MEMQHFIAWTLFLALVLTMLAIDLFVLHRKPHAIHMREALIGALVPITAALAFIAAIYFAYDRHFLQLGVLPPEVPAGSPTAKYYPTTGGEAAVMYLTGYIVELSLSADNVFLFVILMSFFKVARELQHRVLFWGVIGALVMRAIMIKTGAELLQRFEWVIYIFGAFLIITGIKMIFCGGGTEGPGEQYRGADGAEGVSAQGWL